MSENISTFVKTADWKAEKHVPAIDAPAEAKAGEPVEISVAVGKEIPHPNTVEHHISWLALHFVPAGSQTSIELGRFEFSAHGQAAKANEGPAHVAPSVKTTVCLAASGTLHATAYCNIHGLWTSSAAISVVQA
ncbi:MAG: class II SORL domain-containing protein [Kiritimatiellae bacterium]|nr:class II SORL domain-containing protein [Kiritimatiellia bacterium]